MYSDKSPRSSSERSDTTEKRSQRPISQRPHLQDFTYNPPGSSQSREGSQYSSAPDTGQRKENDLFEGFGLHMQQADLRQPQQQLAVFHDQPQSQLEAFMRQQQQQLEAFMRQQQQQLAALMQRQQAGTSDVPAYQSNDEYHEQHSDTPSEMAHQLSNSSINRERLQPLHRAHGSPPDAGQPSRRGPMTLAMGSGHTATNTLLRTELETSRFSPQSRPFSTGNLIGQQNLREEKRVFSNDTGSTSTRDLRAFRKFLEEDEHFDQHNPYHQAKYDGLVKMLNPCITLEGGPSREIEQGIPSQMLEEEDGQFDPHNPDHQAKYEDLVRLLNPCLPLEGGGPSRKPEQGIPAQMLENDPYSYRFHQEILLGSPDPWQRGPSSLEVSPHGDKLPYHAGQSLSQDIGRKRGRDETAQTTDVVHLSGLNALSANGKEGSITFSEQNTSKCIFFSTPEGLFAKKRATEKEGAITFSDHQAGPSDQVQEQKQPNAHALRLLEGAKDFYEYSCKKMTKDDFNLLYLYNKGLRSNEAKEANKRLNRLRNRFEFLNISLYDTNENFEKSWREYINISKQQRIAHDKKAEISDYEG